MSTSSVVTILILLAIVVIVLFFIFYKRASKEVAFVRTGFGGEKVVKSGGAIVIPRLHEVVKVYMNTLRLEVQRVHEQSVITKDRMRVMWWPIFTPMLRRI
jgi:flotillin